MKVSDLLLAVRSLLDGKKTYLAGLALVFSGLSSQDWNLVLQGLSVCFLRNAITKV